MKGVFRLATAVLFAAAASAATVEVHNPSGSIEAAAVDREDVGVVGPSDRLRVERSGERVLVRVSPGDAPVHLKLLLPIGFALDARTETGDITVEGLMPFARLTTDSGAVRLRIPYRGSRFQIDCKAKPVRTDFEQGLKVLTSELELAGGRRIWRYRDPVRDDLSLYANYRVSAGRPSEIAIEDWTMPRDWPLQFHWSAPGALNEIVSGARKASRTQGPDEAETAGSGNDGLVFRSDVRMVSLMLSATAVDGSPATDLEEEDFEVREDGTPQSIAFAGSEEAPFNLAILLDLSGSARNDREPMRIAAEGFIRLAGPKDRIAVYALSDGMFHVVSPLTSDRRELLKRVADMPRIAGASPLYDAITLAYATELHQREGERNALIVVSDGIDNRISNQEMPSSLKAKQLTKGAEYFNALVYPVFLRSGERFGRSWSTKARKALEELAEATGGRLFAAASVEDLAPVFPQVGEELRSVYSIAYYPEDQHFDGAWRNVEVKVHRPKIRVRVRDGYYAR